MGAEHISFMMTRQYHAMIPFSDSSVFTRLHELSSKRWLGDYNNNIRTSIQLLH